MTQESNKKNILKIYKRCIIVLYFISFVSIILALLGVSETLWLTFGIYLFIAGIISNFRKKVVVIIGFILSAIYFILIISIATSAVQVIDITINGTAVCSLFYFYKFISKNGINKLPKLNKFLRFLAPVLSLIIGLFIILLWILAYKWNNEINQSMKLFIDAKTIQQELREYKLEQGIYPNSLNNLIFEPVSLNVSISNFTYSNKDDFYQVCFYIEGLYKAENLKVGENCFGPEEELKY